MILLESGIGFFQGLVIALISYVFQRGAAHRDTRILRPRFRDYLPAPVFMGTFPAVLATCLYLLIGGHEKQVFTSPLEAWRYAILPITVAVAVTLCLGGALFPDTYAWVEQSNLRRWFRGSFPRSPKRYGIYLLIGAGMGIWGGIFVGVFAAAWHGELSLWLASVVSIQCITLSSTARYQNQIQQGE